MIKIIENITNYKFYFETYSQKKITISPTQNSEGVLLLDDLGNKLSNAFFTLGDMEFEILTKYTYGDSLLVYDSIGYDLYNGNEQVDMMVEWKQGTRYKIGARTENSISYDSINQRFYFSTLSAYDNSPTDIFRAYMNGYEIPLIDLAKNGISQYIQVVGNSRDKLSALPNGNNMTVIIHRTDQTIVDSIELNYLSVDSIIDIDGMLDKSYFDGNTFSKPYLNIKAISDSNESATDTTKKRRQAKDEIIKTSNTNRLSFEMYSDTKYDDLSLVGLNSKFRIIGIGNFPEKIITWNNCRIIPSQSVRYDKDVNALSYTISYDYREELLVNDGEKVFRAYNEGYYNEEVYG